MKKRGRKSVGKVGSEDMDVDEVVERPPKKAKKNSVNAKKPQSESSDAEERIVQNMDRYMDKLNWETLVKNVDTVERVGDSLMVFFTLYVLSYISTLMCLNIFWRYTGEAVRETTKICKERFPQKVSQLCFKIQKYWRDLCSCLNFMRIT